MRTLIFAAALFLTACGTTKQPAEDFYGRKIQPGERPQGKHDSCTRHHEVDHKDGRCFFCNKFENQ